MIRALAGLVLLLSLPVSPAQASAASAFQGAWRIVRVAGYGAVSSGAPAARAALGRTVRITADGMGTAETACTHHPLAYRVVEVDAFLRDNWQASRADLHLGGFRLAKTAPHIDAECADALVLDRNDLLISLGDGAFFVAKRKR